MAKLLSIGTWAYIFAPDPLPLAAVINRLSDYKYDGIELAGFRPHVHPDDYPTDVDRQKLKALIDENDLRVSGLAADFWETKVLQRMLHKKMITTSTFSKRT